MAVVPPSPVTIDAHAPATPYHTMTLPRPKPQPPIRRTPRAARKLAIPTAPPAPDSQGRTPGTRIAKPPKPPVLKPKPPAPPKPANPADVVAPAAPGFPSYGDPTLDARRRAIQAVTDQAVAAGQADAAASTQRLGELAQLAGMGRVQTEGTTLPPAVAALPGILTQDAQQQQLAHNALAVDSANRMVPYLRAQGVQALQGFDASVRDAQMKARADQLNLLARIYQYAIGAGNAQLAAQTRQEIAAAQIQGANTRSQAQIDAANWRATLADAGKTTATTGKDAAAAKAARTTLNNQWAKAAGAYDFGTRPSGTFFERAIAGGVKPMDAIRIVSAAGVVLKTDQVYKWLVKHLGPARARAATRQLTGEDPPEASGTLGA